METLNCPHRATWETADQHNIYFCLKDIRSNLAIASSNSGRCDDLRFENGIYQLVSHIQDVRKLLKPATGFQRGIEKGFVESGLRLLGGWE